MSRAMERQFQFQDVPVRTVGTDRALWFVAKDVCEALGIVWKGAESISSIPSEWRVLRKLRTTQKNSYGLKAQTEKEVWVINEAAVYKLAFRSNKEAADVFTNWVASEVLPAIRQTGSYNASRERRYLAQGKTQDWIEERVEGVDARKGFTGVLKDHKVEGRGYGECTNAIYIPTIGSTATGGLTVRGLKTGKDNLRDNLSKIELAKVKLAEMLAADSIERHDLQGNVQCASACRKSGDAVQAASVAAIQPPPGTPPRLGS